MEALRKSSLTIVVIVSILGAGMAWGIATTQMWKEKAAEAMRQVTTTDSELRELRALTEYHKKLLDIDHVILSSLASENRINLDSMRSLFLDFPVGDFNDAIEFRLSSCYSISQNMVAKNERISTSLHELRRSLQEYRKFERQLQELERAKTELEHNKSLQDSLHSRLQREIDSLISTHSVNLRVIELKKNGNTVFYIGERADGKPHGYGIGLWSTGGIYKGEWRDGLRNGSGTYVWKEGEVYEGDWKDGMRTGYGKYTWKDKQWYVGGWFENKRHGPGSIYYPNGKLEYEGIWQNDRLKPNGRANPVIPQDSIQPFRSYKN